MLLAGGGGGGGVHIMQAECLSNSTGASIERALKWRTRCFVGCRKGHETYRFSRAHRFLATAKFGNVWKTLIRTTGCLLAILPLSLRALFARRDRPRHSGHHGACDSELHSRSCHRHRAMRPADSKNGSRSFPCAAKTSRYRPIQAIETGARAALVETKRCTSRYFSVRSKLL